MTCILEIGDMGLVRVQLADVIEISGHTSDAPEAMTYR
jgi:hypothetical protein